MRHAKSSWSDGSMSDHERPLNTRGEQSATAIGATLTARGYAPDIIWSSDAKRTRQTAMLLIRAIPGAQEVHYNPDFYHASAEQVLMICGKEIEPQGRLMLLGHNPGWAALHEYFTRRPHDYPTGACTVLERTNRGGGDWLSPSSWRMIDLVLPREIMS
ncbi:SixA phosphatase family protein [Litorimonas sp. RW-G-Af-16]|uniref:SixA phosphatase family protein n=1 Tax=Litorimonas sp. RW-G-Af-16 TaxID=3241168 RepID=UPI00390C4A7E